MAFPRPPSSSSLSEMQLPIVLAPDIDDEMRAGTGLEVDNRPRQDEPQQPPVPQHPIPSMQQAFAESLVEATQGDAVKKPKLRTGDARARRDELLDQDRDDPPPTALWRCRPGQKTHELCRLIAQISFGVYLLLNGMANSQILVVSILQGHIDEVDEFLETTLEDMDLATRDMEERIKHLKLPMDNIGVFERMLEDRKFRMQILEGNQKIEHILARTQAALKQTTRDLAEGLAATREFTIYLAEQQHGSWRQERPDVIDIFDAMKGNTDGWFNAFMDLQARGSTLNALMVRLTDMVSEMERRVGEVSRRTRLSVQPYSSPGHSPQPSDASSVTTPPSSPQINIPNSPPRISLRLSTLNTGKLSLDAGALSAAELDRSTEQQSRNHTTPRSSLVVTSRSPPPEESPLQSPSEPPPPQAPPARNPRRLSKKPPAPSDLPKLEFSKEEVLGEKKEEKEEGGEKDEEEEKEEKEEKEKMEEKKEKEKEEKENKKVEEKKEEIEEESPLYILQPRTYTPQPSPQPSPGISGRRVPRAQPDDVRRPRVDSSSASSVESAAQITLELARPRVEQVVSRPQTARLKVVEIGARTDTKPSPTRTDERPESRPAPQRDPSQAPELVIPQDPEVVPPQRTSLRQRVSLKGTVPISIQVPPPNSMGPQQRPLQAVHRAYQSRDSAYGSDMERPPVDSMASINSSMVEFPPPFVQPPMIPSPHSERQFFRPVQPNPYSPLQQRPHTSGTVAPHHFPAPPRNAPSRMGMSIMSSGTAMTNQTGKTVKKKRSAFGWLKKAFALDEEERAIFEQRKREQIVDNPYYAPRSQEFLDGKRIRPPPGH
ncbi:uncharacterized protein P884DRAFT_298744 [Thermothelomyces heterothallicus CBS 202.75]|uniref:uncharacterized protein n=1 Tax=Thermothelomyces heterothallicus CBS 202.75 TaxID=1149848 RepID=UPI003742BEB8